MADFAVNLDPTALGLPSEADLVAAFRATPGYEAMAKAQADKDARIAAYKAANPGASDFAANFYASTPEEQAQMRANYGSPARGKLHKSMYYSGVAPSEGQTMLDYMLANNGKMPETKVKEGPGLGQALLNAAMLATAGLGVGTIGNALMAGAGAAGAGGAGAAGAGAAGAGAAGAGAAIPSTVAGLVPTSTALGAGSTAAQMGATLAGGLGAAGTAGTLAAAAPTVSELVITAAAGGMSVPQIATTFGIPALAVSNVLQNAAGSNVMQGGEGGDTLSQPGDGTTVDELVITADKLNPATWTDLVPVGTIGSGILAQGVADGLGVPQSSAAGETPANSDIPSNVEGLTTTADALGPDSPAGQLGSKIAAGEIVDKVIKGAEIASKVAPLLGGAAAGGSSGKGGGIPPGFATAGTPGSLSDKFRAQLPAPSGPFANLAARDVSMTPEQWATYGARPEQSFFANVPVRPSGIIEPPARRAPVTPGPNPAEAEPGLRANVTPGLAPSQPVQGFNPTAPSSVNSTSGSDMNQGSMTAEQFAVAMKRMEDARRAPPLPAPTKGFKVGGFAVSGPGTGRSDDIPARLSDGEYVIDAETVALLGDGSSQAGSKRLDEFRANIRKHKGRQLAKGKFSHDARKPEAYLHGGRV